MSSVRISETASDGRNLLVYSTEGLAYIFIKFSEITQIRRGKKQSVRSCEEKENYTNTISKINEQITEAEHFLCDINVSRVP